MAKIKLFLIAAGLVAVTGCTVETAAPQETGEQATAAWLAAIPAQCFAHKGKEYLGLAVECTPGEEAPTCALDAGQQQTPLDGTGNAVISICNCNSDHVYSCLYVGDEATWKL